GQPRDRLAHGRRARDLVVRRQRADDEPVAVAPNLLQIAQRAQRDDIARLRHPELHDRKETLPARQELAIRARFERSHRLTHRLRLVKLEVLHGSSPGLTGPAPVSPSGWPTRLSRVLLAWTCR